MQYHILCFSLTNQEYTWLRLFYFKIDTLCTLKVIPIYWVPCQEVLVPTHLNSWWSQQMWTKKPSLNSTLTEQCGTLFLREVPVPVPNITPLLKGHGIFHSRMTIREVRSSSWVLRPWLHGKNQSLSTTVISLLLYESFSISKSQKRIFNKVVLENIKSDPKLVIRNIVQVYS